MLSLIFTGKGGSFELMPVVRQITWSGAVEQGARKLDFEVLSSPENPGISVPDLVPGAAVSFFEDDTLLFSGSIVSREKVTDSVTVSVHCCDKGFYLLKNQGVYQFSAQSPAAITRRICRDFGIQTGQIAEASAAVTRNFIGTSLYRIIMTAYTLAARQDGKAYQIRFRGDSLDVVEIEKNEQTIILEGGANLQSAAMADSIEKTVTQAAIYDAENRIVRTVRNEEMIPVYGILQAAVRQRDGEDAGAEARRILADSGLAQTMTVEALGDVSCITGNTVAVKEPYTGLCGLFWIVSDRHVWKDGQYYCRLGLSYKRPMDEQEAGSLPRKKAGGKKAAGRKVVVQHLNLKPYEEKLGKKVHL